MRYGTRADACARASLGLARRAAASGWRCSFPAGRPLRSLALSLVVGLALLAGSSAAASATTYDMSGEWEYVLNCACEPPTTHGTALITQMDLATGEYSGTTVLAGFPGTWSGTVTDGKLSLSMVIPDTPVGEVSFAMAEGTLETLTNEFSGSGFSSGPAGHPVSTIAAKRIRTLQQIKEQEEKEQFEREGRAKGEKEGLAKGEKEGMEKGEREGREKGEAEGSAKAAQEVKQKGEQEAKERQAKEAQATTEREAREKAEKGAAEKADTQAREKIEGEAREKVEKETKERKLAEEKKRKKKPKRKPKHKSGKGAKATRARGPIARARPHR